MVTEEQLRYGLMKMRKASKFLYILMISLALGQCASAGGRESVLSSLRPDMSGKSLVVSIDGEEILRILRKTLDHLEVQRIEIYETPSGNMKVTGLRTGYNVYSEFGVGTWVGVGAYRISARRYKIIPTTYGNFPRDLLDGVAARVSLSNDARRNRRADVYVYDTNKFRRKHGIVSNKTFNIRPVGSSDGNAWLKHLRLSVKTAFANARNVRLGVVTRGHAETYINDAIVGRLSGASGNIKLVASTRRELKRILDQQAAHQSGLFDESSTARIGQLLGANFLLGCNSYYIRKRKLVELFCKITNVETGVYHARGNIMVQISAGGLPR